MSTGDRVTRVAADLLAAAAVEGPKESRSAKQQLDYWARVGRAVTSQHSVAHRRVEAALRGDLPMSELSDAEGVVFNAETNTRIGLRLSATHFGRRLAAEGVSTVALNDDGQLIEYRPDGTARELS
ncbi:hypothetical protein FOS14_05205 [Skermania sp. ID1734]|uniref:TA system antitoxin ParD family protein n=1 Tax=Skermania sp. ID1734 TaxID=2597516 RepID=UPI00117EBAD3|nr:hypothetical protein [Skermania sp. ID1734]TSE01142.1 hypothetical protein FOS14_05205 [Skermania sp. ID1734]